MGMRAAVLYRVPLHRSRYRLDSGKEGLKTACHWLVRSQNQPKGGECPFRVPEPLAGGETCVKLQSSDGKVHSAVAS